MQEQALINRGLDQNEARVVVFISRKRMTDISTIAHSLRMPTGRCALILTELVRKGILKRTVGTEGTPYYALSSFFSNILRAGETDEGNSPFNQKLYPVAHHSIKLPGR